MRKLALFLIMFIPVTVMSQVSFQDITFDQAMKQASQESKIILVDIMNPKSLIAERSKIEQELFKQKDVSDFFGKNVICMRMDMSTDAGRQFAPRLMMNMYPTYGFYRANGDLIKVVSPYLIAKNPELLLASAKESVLADQQKKANTRAIDFKNISFDEALKLAAKENKLVFIDAYTDNCQPCMMMAKNIFTLDKVADLFNENFINVKLNLGTVETELAKKYGTKGYPSYLFVNAEGTLIYSNSGYTDADTFMGYGHEAIKKFSGIEFMHGSWNDVLVEAQKTNKPIFVDCYTTWCGPCKMMANTVFREPAVADYFNQNFINFKLDMEKGEGVSLKSKFQIKAYPTFLFMDSQGNIINRIVGGMPGDQFVATAKQGMSGRGVVEMQKLYKGGQRDKTFMLDYMEALSAAYMSDELNQVIQEYFTKADPSDLKDQRVWQIFDAHVMDPDHKAFIYLCENQPEFEKLYGEHPVKGKINAVWSYGFTKYGIKDAQGNKMVDKKNYDAYLKRMKRSKLENYDDIHFAAQTFVQQYAGNWSDFYKTAAKRINNKKMSDLRDDQLYALGRYLMACKDKEIRQRSVKWFEDALVRIETKENAPKPTLPPGVMAAASMVNYKSVFKQYVKEFKN